MRVRRKSPSPFKVYAACTAVTVLLLLVFYAATPRSQRNQFIRRSVVEAGNLEIPVGNFPEGVVAVHSGYNVSTSYGPVENDVTFVFEEDAAGFALDTRKSYRGQAVSFNNQYVDVLSARDELEFVTARISKLDSEGEPFGYHRLYMWKPIKGLPKKLTKDNSRLGKVSYDEKQKMVHAVYDGDHDSFPVDEEFSRYFHHRDGGTIEKLRVIHIVRNPKESEYDFKMWINRSRDDWTVTHCIDVNGL